MRTATKLEALKPMERESQSIEQAVLRALEGIRFGSVEITIHDSRVVQIERREKLRLDRD